MNTTIPMLLCTPLLVTGLAAQRAVQETGLPKVGSRVPIDVSVGGVGDASRRAAVNAARGGGIGFVVRPSAGSLTSLECLQRITDEATGGCLTASSTATSGALFPYPGIHSTFAPPAFVGGGIYNTASGLNATVGGGVHNTASANYTTVGGGYTNTAFGDFATVGGGISNAASGYYATVPGGILNAALGYSSFAAGRFAKANHDGAFVWGDSVFSAIKTSSHVDEFNVYCSGGARFLSNRFATTGVLLAPGGGSWSAVSDRDSKENVQSVDGRAVLEQLVALPLATWSYKAQDDSIRHMGPMAQDFHAAFGLGVSDKLIDTIDPDGVALAAIQGLNAELEERLAEKDAEIEELRATNDDLYERVERLEALTGLALAR